MYIGGIKNQNDAIYFESLHWNFGQRDGNTAASQSETIC